MHSSDGTNETEGPLEPGRSGGALAAGKREDEASVSTPDQTSAAGQDAEGGRDPAALVDEARRAGPDAGDTDPDPADIALGDVRLDDSWREELRRPAIEQFRPAIGLTTAIVLHLAVAVAGYASFAGITGHIGGGGADDNSISVELITRDALDAIRAQRLPTPTPVANAPAQAAALAPVAGTEQARPEIQQMQDGAPPDTPTETPALAPPPSRAPIVAEPAPTGTLAAAREPGASDPADVATEAETAEPPPSREPAPTPPPTPTQSQAASQAQDAQAATETGGATSRSLRVATLPDATPRAPEAARAAGQAAEGYAADLVRALVRLEDHLQARNLARNVRHLGRVELLLRLAETGAVEALSVARSSGNTALDRQALNDVAGFRFPTPPPALSTSQRTFQLPITYR